MNITIDTSALIAVITNEPTKSRLIEITQGADLIAPHSVHWEIANSFSAMFKRNRISLNDALTCIEVYKKIPVRYFDVDMSKSLEICHSQKMYAYDSYLIRCAQENRSPLLTLDSGLTHIATQLGVNCLEV